MTHVHFCDHDRNQRLAWVAVHSCVTGALGAKFFRVAAMAAACVASVLPATAGRVNIAKYQVVTASSVNGQRLASYVTDGVIGNDNRWQGSSSTWQWAQIDFPFPVEVGSAQVFSGVNDTSAVNTFYLQYFDGSAWVTIPGGSASGNTNVERSLVFTQSVTASSFRILGENGNLNIRELALYPPNGPEGCPLGTDLTVNLAHKRPTAATANTVGNFALNAVDGRATDSMWQTSTAGTNTLDIDLRVATKIGSAHLYSGSSGVSPLPAFVLKYWDGSAWQNIPGTTVSGNTNSDLVVSFTELVTTTKVRFEFTNPGITSIRELSIFSANTNNVGYPIGTNIINSGPIGSYETYNDAFYLINNPSFGRKMSVPANGQPSLDPPGLTFGQSQYQVLLNLSTGTYRLRNRASGKCLSGAQLDKTPGQPLTDASYSALPHQDWILEPLGGGNFQFINQWSGLAIDTEGGATTQGTALVQNTATNTTTQQWQISKYVGYPKKGIGGTTFATAFHPAWAYNWGRLNPDPFPEDATFYPMQWGSNSWDIGSPQGPLWQNYPLWRKRADGIHLLGFNEPDRTDQSNIPLSTAVTLWPRLQELDLPLASPSPGTLGGDGGWLDTFYTQADSLGYRVDYTAVHTYPGPNGGSANNLINFVNSAYTYNGKNRPVWLTEFSFVDWYKNQTWSEEDNYNCLAEFLWRAEGNDKLRKYALFVFTETADWPQPANAWTAVKPAPRSNSYDINGNMTAFGKLYAGWDGDTTVRPDKTYMIHNRALRKRMANPVSTNPLQSGRTIRTDGQIVNWTLVSTGVSNRYYVVSSFDGRRLSYATASNPNNDPALVAAGTTGVNVEWSLTHNEHGWYYLDHPNTSTRLKLVSFNTGSNLADYQMVAAATIDNNTQWRFIVPVTTAPVLAAIPAKTVSEGVLLTFTATATDADFPANALTYSLVGAPAGATIDASTGVFTWTPTAAQGPASYNFTVRVSDGALSHEQAVDVTVNDPDFNSFVNNPLYGLAANDRDFNDDPDSDGMVNGLEAFFGTHPGQSSTGLGAPSTNRTTTIFTHPRNPNLPVNLSIAYEWSPDLATWYPGNGVAGPLEGPRVTITSQTMDNTSTVTAVSNAAQEKIFLRAVVRQN